MHKTTTKSNKTRLQPHQVWDFVFDHNTKLRQQANDYLGYSMMKRYKDQCLSDELTEDSAEFRERAGFHDAQDLLQRTRGK